MTTSRTYNGIVGNTYAFYSIATDNVGNREYAPGGPDALTAVILNRSPSAPNLYAPSQGGEIFVAYPTLTILNSTDPDGGTLTYESEIYSKADFTHPALTSVNSVPEGISTTSWQSGAALQKNAWYSWRARAFDSQAFSEWMAGVTFYARAADIYVSPPGTIDASGSDDTIIVQQGTY